MDLGAIDHAVAPGDDFFAHVNGGWLEANSIPEHLASIDNFTILAERTSVQLRELIESLAASDLPPASDERRIVDAYRAFLNEGTRTHAAMITARPLLDRIEGAGDLGELLAVAAEPGFAPLVALEVTTDPDEPQAHVLSIGPGPLGLPARDHYLDDSERNGAIRASYRAYLSLLLREAGRADSETSAQAVLAFERELAALRFTPEKLRDPGRTRSLIATVDLAALVPTFPLSHLLQAAGFGKVMRLLAQQLPPAAGAGSSRADAPLPATMRLLTQTPLSVLKAHLSARFLDRHASLLGATTDDAKFALHGRLIRGQAQPQPRWKRAIHAVETQVGELLGARYVARHFPPASRAQTERLTAGILTAMRESLDACPWLGEETKRQALAKLAALDTQIGYGERPETYAGLSITADDPLANALAAAHWKHEDAKARLGRPVDRTQWPFVPQTVNASYREARNQIVFPAGILQPPFFAPSADPAVNYGAIGAVIGHEIGHGFDDQGSRYDGDGALRNWWRDEDRKAFDALTSPLAAQYDSYCPLDDGTTCLNGRLTLGESIGDLVGLELAYRAYRASLGGAEAPVIDGYTGDQRFFLAFAQLWRASQREELVRARINTDPHAPPRFRVNGTVRNMSAWYDAFDIRPDHALYLPPEQRVTIW